MHCVKPDILNMEILLENTFLPEKKTATTICKNIPNRILHFWGKK